MTERDVRASTQLFAMQCALEESIRMDINEFERASGMSVHSIKVYRSDPVDGRRLVHAVEVAALLR